MPDPTRPRRPPRLRHSPPSPATEADRAAFARALAELSPDAVAASRRPSSASPPPSPSALLRDLQHGRRRVPESGELSVRHRTQKEARAALLRFLRTQRAAGARFARVVHGQGYGSPGGRSVLAHRVPQWLAEWRAELVDAWGTARREDGGRGALYVVLREPGAR